MSGRARNLLDLFSLGGRGGGDEWGSSWVMVLSDKMVEELTMLNADPSLSVGVMKWRWCGEWR